MRKLILTLALVLLSGPALADPSGEDLACDGRLLHDGAFMQIRYPRNGLGTWTLASVRTEARGFSEASFDLERFVCLRYRRGSCFKGRSERAEVAVIGRHGMTLKDAAETIARLNGMRQVRRAGREYRISGGRGRRVMVLKRHPIHDRFLVLLVAEHGFGTEFAAARTYADHVGIGITHP